jgi:hypothetical protein
LGSNCMTVLLRLRVEQREDRLTLLAELVVL